MNLRLLKIFLLSLGIFSFSTNSYATLLTYNFQGTIGYAQNGLESLFAPGEVAYVTVKIDSATTPYGIVSENGGPGLHADYTIDELYFSTSSYSFSEIAPTASTFNVEDNWNGLDGIWSVTQTPNAGAIGNLFVSSMNVILYFDPSAFADTSLPSENFLDGISNPQSGRIGLSFSTCAAGPSCQYNNAGSLLFDMFVDPVVVPPPAAAPIPATLPLLGLGLAALGYSRRKRKQHF